MFSDWQTVVSLIIVAAAVVWMLRRLFALGQTSSGCGSCRGCASNTNAVDRQNEITTPQRVYQLTGAPNDDAAR